ncbi:MAG: sigma-70 family RNA polymerase sigma factor [Actinomycetia bacterium]|nr:sigma-70 family RNA polymerase sigma factor [Actinomycetes bacterium]
MSAPADTGILSRMRIASGSDEHVLVRATGGDARAFEEIYRRYHSAVYGYCLMRLGDRHAAEDATQETFLKVSTARGEAVENVKAWLFTVARNVVIDATRRRGTLPDQVDLEAALDSTEADNYEAPFLAMDVTSNVFIALRSLSARDRKALVLREFHDASSAEIAEEFDIRPGAVDVLLCRARAAFGQAYAEVADLPFACRQATELIYREMGSGASERQLELMQSHLAVCPRCAATRRRAHGTRFLGGFGPWLWHGLQTAGLAGPLARLQTLGQSVVGYVDGTVLSGWSVPARAALGAVLVLSAVTPSIVGAVAPKPLPTFVSGLMGEATVSGAPSGEASAPARDDGAPMSGHAEAMVGAHDSVMLHMDVHPKLSDGSHHTATTDATHASDHTTTTDGMTSGSAPTGAHTIDSHTGTGH